jgi:hypothetical protein
VEKSWLPQIRQLTSARSPGRLATPRGNQLGTRIAWIEQERGRLKKEETELDSEATQIDIERQLFDVAPGSIHKRDR